MTKENNTEPIIRTKLHRPPIDRAHLHREHLLNRLSQGRCRPLALVSAPAGYGKSTLVSCWLQDCNVPSAWVSLDENDNDLRIFPFLFRLRDPTDLPRCMRTETQSMLGVDPLPPVSVMARSLINELDQD